MSRKSKFGFQDKKLATWVYYTPDLHRIVWSVQITIRSEYREAKVVFVATPSSRDVVVPPPIEDVDLIALKSRCEQATTNLLQFSWTPMIYVTGRGGREANHDGSIGAAVGIEFERIEISTVDGTRYSKHRGSDSVTCRRRFEEGKTEHGSVSALIHDTPENLRALESIVEGMNVLAERVKAVLSPKQISKTLANVPATLLPPVPASSKKIRRER